MPAFSAPLVAGETKNPSFLAIDAKQRFLYAVGELSSFEGKKSGAVSAFAIALDSGSPSKTPMAALASPPTPADATLIFTLVESEGVNLYTASGASALVVSRFFANSASPWRAEVAARRSRT